MDFIFTLSICQFVFILLFVFIYILKLDVYKKLTLFLCASLFIVFLSSAILLSYNYYGYKETFIYILVGVATCSFLASLFILLPFIINFITKKDDVIYNSNEYGASRTPMYYQRPIKNGYVESLYPTKKLDVTPNNSVVFDYKYAKKVVDGLLNIDLSQNDKKTATQILSFLDGYKDNDATDKRQIAEYNFLLIKLCIKYNYDPVG